MIIEKPNSRWGWMVVLAAACIRIIVYGISNTSGVVYVVMLDVFQRSKAETSWVSSLIIATTFFVCPFSGVLVNRFGTRKVAFSGGILAAAGLITSSFSPNLFLFCMAYGVLTGIGCGMTFIPSSVAVAGYFKKRRNLAMGIASAGGGVGSFVFPPVIKILENYYSWRGMFLFIAGIGLNISVFAMLYRPVLDVSNSEDETEDETQDINNDRDMQKYTKRKLSLRMKNKWDFLRNSGFYVLALNNLLFGFGYSIVYGHLEAYVKFELGLGELSGAMLYSVIGITVVFAKLGQGILANMKKVKILHPMYQYIFFYLVAGVATMFLLVKTNYVGLVFFSIAFGTGCAANGGCIIPAILIDMTGLESFSLSYGLILWMFAGGLLLGAPAAGLMYDRLHSYEPAFALAAVVIILAAIIMIFPCRQVFVPRGTDEVTIEINPQSEKLQIKFDMQINVLSGSGRIYTEDSDLQTGHIITSSKADGMPNGHITEDVVKPETERLLGDEQNVKDVDYKHEKERYPDVLQVNASKSEEEPLLVDGQGHVSVGTTDQPEKEQLLDELITTDD